MTEVELTETEQLERELTETEPTELLPGMIISGLWSGNEYRIERMLGEGANGQVFLARNGKNGMHYALKLGNRDTDLKPEIALLKKISPTVTNGKSLFVEADIFTEKAASRPYYVMRYVEGVTLVQFVTEAGRDWLYVVGYHLLRRLAQIHGKGFAYGDLKPSNVLVSGEGRVDLIDFGGAARFGKPIRQCTPAYDREFWNCGIRIADSGYDLFSFAMLFMQLTGVEIPGALSEEVELLPHERNGELLKERLRANEACLPVADILSDMIDGRYVDSRKALAAWRVEAVKAGLPPARESRFGLLNGLIAASLLVAAVSVYMIVTQ